MRLVVAGKFKNRLVRALGIEDLLLPISLEMSSVVVPSVDVMDLLWESKLLEKTGDAQAGFRVGAVPAGEIWHLVVVSKTGTSGAVGISLSWDGGGGPELIIAQTGKAAFVPGTPMRLSEGWSIECNGSANIGDTSRTISGLYLRRLTG